MGSLNWRKSIFFGVLCLPALVLYSQPLWAEDGFTFKKLLMPGEVIEGHAEYEQKCDSCHRLGQGVTQTSLCLDCHENVATDIAKNQGFHGRMAVFKNRDCRGCHSDHIGRQGDIVNLDKDSFDHKQTDFELAGKHARLVCASCHLPNKKYSEAPKPCFSCHEIDDHHKGALSKACQNCHSPSAWGDARFDHDETSFSLLGMHQKIQCNACHPDEKYNNTPITCSSCHAINDVHNSVNGEQCGKCHSESGWKELIFDHDIDTNFTLNNGHNNLSCNACHEQSGFDKKLSTACIDCHQNDDEHNGKNGHQCNNCHTEAHWAKITFNHERDTQFALREKHAELSCESCHRSGTKNVELGTACIACHRVDDVHQGQQGTQCSNCHNSTDWLKNVRFNHDLTPFPLVGMHAVTGCDSCHSSKVFSEAENSCIDCHKEDDSHALALGPDCAGCHNPNDWQLWLFNHDTQTEFQLDGAHLGLSCNECHIKPTKSKVKQSSSCGVCHLNDDIHNRRFGRTCERCHTTESFKDIRVQ